MDCGRRRKHYHNCQGIEERMTTPTLDQILHILEVNKGNNRGVCAALVVLAIKADILEARLRF